MTVFFRACALSCAVLASATLPPSGARAQVVEPDARAMVLLRALAYERGLARRSDDLRLVVLIGSSGAAARDGRAMKDAFAGLAQRVEVAGRRLRVIPVEHESARETLGAIRSARADVVYVAVGLDEVVGELGGLVASDRRVMICGDPGDVGEGCMMSVERHGRRMRVVMHLRLADAVGKSFDARLLRLSRIVR
jgi:hypothetical protein